MAWVSTYPDISSPIPTGEDVVDLIEVQHTPLICLLTKTSLIVCHVKSLLPIALTRRDEKNIEQYGSFINMKGMDSTIDLRELKQLVMVNLFVETDLGHIFIYLVKIQYTTSTFEIHNIQNNHMLQKGVPLSLSNPGFSLLNLIKTTTKSLVVGGSNYISLENLEHFKNASLEDDSGHTDIPDATITISKILKIGSGICKYWMKQNSFNLIVYKKQQHRILSEQAGIEPEPLENNTECFKEAHGLTNIPIDLLQVINIRTSETEVFDITRSDWYTSSAPLKYISYSSYNNYFLFVNDDMELWFLKFLSSKESTATTIGFKLQDLTPDRGSSLQITFNPIYDLFLFQIDSDIHLYEIVEKSKKFKAVYLKCVFKLAERNNNPYIMWASCGNYFTLSSFSSGAWYIIDRFGGTLFSSSSASNLISSNSDNLHSKILTVSKVIPLANSATCLLLDTINGVLYLLDLLIFQETFAISDGPQIALFYSANSLKVMGSLNATFNDAEINFPMPPTFKSIISSLQVDNGKNSLKDNKNGRFVIGSNRYYQLSLSYGNYLAISTPYLDGTQVNQILWIHFRNLFVESFNIVNHVWADDFLILFNRTSEKSNVFDELVVLDTTSTRFAHGGANVKLDSDSIIWRYGFNNRIIAFDLMRCEVSEKNKPLSSSTYHLTLFTSDSRLIILEVTRYKSNSSTKIRLKDKLDNSLFEEIEKNKSYQLFIELEKSLNLSALNIEQEQVKKISMIDNQHFLILITTGELLFVADTRSLQPTNHINRSDAMGTADSSFLCSSIACCVEKFQISNINFVHKAEKYLIIHEGEDLKIYNLHDLFRTVVFNDKDKSLSINYEPIFIPSGDIYPLFAHSLNNLTQNIIDLVGLENQAYRKNGFLLFNCKIKSKIILQFFIEHDLSLKIQSKEIHSKYVVFKAYNYCLELLLFNFLQESKLDALRRLIDLINVGDSPEAIYVAFLRKIEAGHWNTFFKYLGSDPIDFMRRLIQERDISLCYNYLTVYLNIKREDSLSSNQLTEEDEEVIMKIVEIFAASEKWNWLIELCRYIKILEPTNSLLNRIYSKLSVNT